MNQFGLLVVMMCDACILTDDLLKGFLLEDQFGEVLHPHVCVWREVGSSTGGFSLSN